MATWSGTTPYATKKQLVSSIAGLYDDLQDFQFSTITSVSTLTVKDWLSVPTLYVSDIQGYNFDISGIVYADAISTQIGNFNFTAVSTIQFVVNPSLTVSFNAKEALFGALSGLGFLIFETLLGIGAGTGLALKGLGEGIAAMIMARGTNTYINNTQFELLNGATQLQVSTLGNAYPLYSTITRYVSSISPNEVAGAEIFLSSFFTPGTTCIRSISDPYSIPSSDSNIATSSIQMFGQWVPLPFDDETTFLSLSNTTLDPLFTLNRTTADGNDFLISSIQSIAFSNAYPVPVNTETYPHANNFARMFLNQDFYSIESSYISTNYQRFQSTYTTNGLFFIPSTISTPAEITYSNSFFIGDTAICEPDETGFRSTATFDFIAQGQDLFIQWGLAADNLNSTIAVGTAKRVSWDIPANYSNFIDIPGAQSTITNESFQQTLAIGTNPYEIKFTTSNGSNASQVAWDVNGMTFGSFTSLSNYQNYPYQFNSSVYVNGTLEAQNIIALSTIFAVSTIIETQLSTQTVIANVVNTPELVAKEALISTLKASSNYTNDYITALSRMRLAGFQTPISLVTGTSVDAYDYTHCFDFICDRFPQLFTIQSKPSLKELAVFTSTNVEIPDLVVNNLTASNLIYTNAEAPTIQTSTISFGWTGNFTSPVVPDYALSQTLETPPGLFWNDYIVASNQVINLMNFSNTVNMLAQQFSTPLTYINTTFDGTNRQGWASTIFYNALTTPARVNLGANAGNGELSLQAQTNGVIVSLNTNPGGLGGVPVPVPVGSTYKFTSGGASWTTLSNAPTPGTISYTNNLKMSMDYEAVNISTTDTLNINAEQINLNGIVNIPNAQLTNLYVDQFMSTNIFNGQTFTAATFPTTTTNSFSQPFAMYNTTNTASDGFINLRGTITPSRGFNLFNSYNLNEWNNTQFNIDTNTAAGRPTMIVGEVIATSPPVGAYAGQFWINNNIDSPALVIPIYQNVEGVLTTIGNVFGSTYARVYTNNGTNWFVQSNVPQPMGITNVTYSNYYTVTMNSELTTINAGMPLVYNTPSIIYNTNKVFFYSPQIRVATIDAPSFNTREAGMENVFYYDSNIIFSYQGNTEWESAAFNPVLGIYGNTYYSLAGWICFACMTRFRGDGDTLVLAWDIDATAYPVGGGATDYVWGSARYIQVRAQTQPEGNIRENYLMIPRNYFNFQWEGQGPIN